ncbi:MULTISPECIES: hypothetical protein [unclassified Brachybacterium]|uniref:hypothetical protein n=1 Tax=unclassified Brachybacterium TaxID=2623841 RepID=UPI0036203679
MSERPTDQTDPSPRAGSSAPDSSAAHHVLDQADGGEPRRLLSLSDEQLAGLDGHQQPQFTAMPWLDQRPDQAAVAADVGLRSLIADGRVSAARDGATGRLRWVAGTELRGCQLLRRTAARFATAERTVQSESGPLVSRAYYYVHETGVLEEEVTPSGIHHFTPLRVEQVPARIATLIDPNSVAGQGGAPVTVRRTELASGHPLAARLADTRAQSVLTTVHADDDSVQQVSVYVTGSEVLTMEALDPAAEDPPLEFRPVDAGDLVALAAAVVS